MGYLINEDQRDRSADSFEGISDLALQFAVVEFIKLILATTYYLWRRRHPTFEGWKDADVRVNGHDEEEEQPLNHMNGNGGGNGFYEHTYDRSPAVRGSRQWHSTQARAGPRIGRVWSLGLIVLLATFVVNAKYQVSSTSVSNPALFSESLFRSGQLQTTSMDLSRRPLQCLHQLSSRFLDYSPFLPGLLTRYNIKPY